MSQVATEPSCSSILFTGQGIINQRPLTEYVEILLEQLNYNVRRNTWNIMFLVQGSQIMHGPVANSTSVSVPMTGLVPAHSVTQQTTKSTY